MYESKVKYFYGTGRRKHSVARVRIYPGSGNVTINGRGIDDYFGPRNRTASSSSCGKSSPVPPMTATALKWRSWRACPIRSSTGQNTAWTNSSRTGALPHRTKPVSQPVTILSVRSVFPTCRQMKSAIHSAKPISTLSRLWRH